MNLPRSAMFDVSAMIVNYNAAAHIRRCVHSLRQQEDVRLEIIIVDNRSSEDDLSLLVEIEQAGATLVRSEENLGFGRANNLAATHACGEFLLIINPDAEFHDNSDLHRLCTWLEGHPEAGMVGPEIFEPGKNKYVMPKADYPSADVLAFTGGLAGLPGNIAWLLGACLLIRKNTYASLGGFDPDFFLYGEDTDLGLRLRKTGLSLGYCPDAQVRHVGGASAATLPSLEKFLRKKRGYFLFCRKHYDSRDLRRIARKMRRSSRIKLAFLRAKRLLGLVSAENLQRMAPKWQAEILAATEVLDDTR